MTPPGQLERKKKLKILWYRITEAKKLEVTQGAILKSEAGGRGLWETRERGCLPPCFILHCFQLGAEDE